MTKKIALIFTVLSLVSCQKKHSDGHTQDDIIIEFAARLEEHSPKYQYDHTKKDSIIYIDPRSNSH